MTNVALLLTISGSTFHIADDIGPLTTGRPMDGTVAARPVETQADVWLTFRPDTLLNFQRVALGAQQVRRDQPTTKPVYFPQSPIAHKDVPNDQFDYCFAVVNQGAVARRIEMPKDLALISANWRTQIGSYNGSALGELRYPAVVLGSARKQKLRLYLWRAEETPDGKYEWKLKKQADAPF